MLATRQMLGEYDMLVTIVSEAALMDILIDWQVPVQVTKVKKIIVVEDHLPDAIEDKAGVYFFSRKHGSQYLPFYIGETLTLRKRLKGHLNWTKLADVLRGIYISDDTDKTIKQGDRYFHYGYLITKKGQKKKKCIQIVQRHLIRDAMAQGLPLLNEKLTGFKTDTITFSGTKKSRAIYGKEFAVPA